MAVIRGVLFDMDDTLFLERDFVRSGFQQVARQCSGWSGLSSDKIFDYLWGLFEHGVRGDTFNRLLMAHPSVAERYQIEDLVLIYRSQVPDIELLPGALEIIQLLQMKGCKVGLLSDGWMKGQQAKVQALRLDRLLDPIILTDRWGRSFWKPHTRGYDYASRAWNLPSQTLMYVGDNPDKDFVAPRKLGWCTVRLRKQGQLNYAKEPVNQEYAPHFEISILSDLITQL